MGCDIHSYAEVKKNGKWELVTNVFPLSDFDKDWYKKEKGDHPFYWRSYGMFGFLAGVRNYSCCEVIVEPRGIPEDATDKVKEECEKWGIDGHSHSWITAKELAEFDYDKELWNRRITREEKPGFFNGAALANEGEGTTETYREFLGEAFFEHLEVLKSLSDNLEDVRIVFWFDN